MALLSSLNAFDRFLALDAPALALAQVVRMSSDRWLNILLKIPA
jgi:hypothetical protein